MSALLSFAAGLASAGWGSVQGYLLYRTSQFGTINEGNEGCVWFLMAAPSIYIGYLVGGVGAMFAAIALFLGVRARSWPLALLAIAAFAAGAGLIALSAYGSTLLFE